MISASQTVKARDCLRLWALDWQAEDKEPPGPPAELGKAVHKVAEDYHARGQAPDRNTEAGRLFLPALPYLPRPFVGRTEGEFTASVSGVEYRGYIDLECMGSDLPGVQDLGVRTPAVVDYKTVKALTQNYMLDGPGEFLDDPQCLLYALKRLIQSGAQAVLLRWVYIRRGEWDPARLVWTGRPGAEARDALLTRAQVVDAFGRIVHPLAARLVQLKKEKPDPLTLPPSPARCLKYGPRYACRWISKCNLSPAEKLGGLMEDDVDLLEQLKARMATEPAKGVNPPEAKTEPTAPAPAPAPAPSAPASTSGQGPGHMGRLTSDEVDFVKALFKALRG